MAAFLRFDSANNPADGSLGYRPNAQDRRGTSHRLQPFIHSPPLLGFSDASDNECYVN
jgi:hypothetical protein